MIRFSVTTIILTVLIASSAFAQDSTPKVQVFGGFALLHTPTGGLTDTTLDINLHQTSDAFGVATNFNGWNAEVQYNADRWIGVAADFGGRNGSPITGATGISGIPSGNGYTFLAGPVISYRTKSRITPFAHILAGFDRISLNAGTITGPSAPVPVAATTYDDFAVALGGGLDYRIVRHFAVRLGQFDYYHTTLNLNKFYASAFGVSSFQGLAVHQGNVRVSAGAVLQF
ncbi:MAG: outer membrane beta-barrel protein [Terriglobales bacterium]